MILDGVKKSAILLMLLGSDQAVEVLKNLHTSEICDIITDMVYISKISNKNAYNILNQCIIDCNNSCNFISFHDDTYISSIALKILEEKSANLLLKKAFNNRNFFNKINQLNNIPAKDLAYLINEENPNIITAILFFLNRKHAARVILFFKIIQQVEIINLLAKFKNIKDNFLIELIKIIDILLKKKEFIISNCNNLKVVMEILCFMDLKNKYKIINNIYQFDQKIAKKIIVKIFSFHDIMQLTDEGIRIIMQKIDRKTLMFAIKNENKAVQLKFLKNMPRWEEDKFTYELSNSESVSDNLIFYSKKIIVTKIKELLNIKKIFFTFLDKAYV